MRVRDLSYASGFIDGEGYIQYVQSPYKRIRIEVCGTEFPPIRFLQKLFGGRIYNSSPRITGTGKKAKLQEIWVVLNRDACKVCHAILPYLKITRKKEIVRKIISHYV